MKLLLDTCTFLWIVADAPELSPRARDLFQAADNEVYLSAASAWEIAVKHGLGRLPLPDSPDRFVRDMRDAHGIESLPIDEESALHVSRLPAIHRDPFDRMIVSQAIVHGLTILTPDALVIQTRPHDLVDTLRAGRLPALMPPAATAAATRRTSGRAAACPRSARS